MVSGKLWSGILNVVIIGEIEIKLMDWNSIIILRIIFSSMIVKVLFS